MNVLEKILEEIKEAKEKINLDSSESNINTALLEGVFGGLSMAEGIIQPHIAKNAGWIPVTERLPEENNSIFAKFKGTDRWNDAMFEKDSDEVLVTIELEDGTRKTTTSYTLDGKWKAERERSIVKKKVVAWMPLPEAYKGE